MQRSRRQWLAHAISIAAAAALPGVARASAAPPEVASRWPAARLQGQGRLRFLGLHVYDARLWAPAVVDAERWWSTPLALELQYARRLVGRLIAERSIEEMRRQQPIAADRAADWLEAMNGLFPDVAGGDRLCGVLLPGESARFYFNGRARGELRDPDFARLFFGIWLAPETSEPALRGQLLGLAPR